MTTLDLDLLGAAPARRGHVHLIGGGPGDPSLVTVRAAALLATADFVAYDRLSPPQLLSLVPAHAERVCVGKTVDHPGWAQDDTNDLLVNEARAGKAVVRLKGGDPFVFGRGGEEALACRAAGVPVEVVSGVSSAIAAPAAAGIPVTHRGIATGVAFITGHEDPTKPETQIDWTSLATFHGTLVFLMGVRNAGRIAAMLVANGKDPATPAAAIHRGTVSEQCTVTSDLAGLADAIHAAGLRSPAAIVVGDVVGLRNQLGDLGHIAEDCPEPTEPDFAAAVLAAGPPTSPATLSAPLTRGHIATNGTTT